MEISIVDKWHSFMDNQGGGWRTYQDEEALRARLRLDYQISLSGWLAPVECVSAVALYVLSLFPESADLLEKTALFLSNRRNYVNGSWKSYWWSSDIYATAFAVRAFRKIDKFKEYAILGSEWLINQQNKNGYWSHSVKNQSSPFYTALACLALMEVDFNKYQKAIGTAMDWLLNNQTEDGSWSSGRILRIPSSDIFEIERVRKWRNSSFGVNILVDDHNRVFTTSTVVNTLDQFRKMLRQ